MQMIKRWQPKLLSESLFTVKICLYSCHLFVKEKYKTVFLFSGVVTTIKPKEETIKKKQILEETIKKVLIFPNELVILWKPKCFH